MGYSRARVGAVLVCLVLLVADSAWSDGPLGPVINALSRFMEGAAFVFVLEPLVVLGEALAYTRYLGLRFRRALGTSLVANMASYCAGVLAWFCLSFAFSGTLASREARWALGLPLTLAVEVPLVVRMNRGTVDSGRLRRCAFVANCVSYLLLWIIVDVAQLGGE